MTTPNPNPNPNPPADDDDDPEVEGLEARGVDSVPYHKFSAMAAKRRVLRNENRQQAARIAELEGKLKAAEAPAQELEGWKTKYAAIEEELGLTRAGLTDPDGIEVARALHRRSGTKEPLPAWLDQQRELAKTDLAKVPKALAVYLQPTPTATTEAADQGKGAGGTGAAGTGLANTRGGVRPEGQGAARQVLTPEKILEIQQRCQASGDWSEWLAATGRKSATA